MRKIQQDKDNRSDQEQGTEKTEVAEGDGLQRHQSEEGTDRRDIAHNQRDGNLPECRFHVGRMLKVRYQVQGIIDRNSQYHRRDSDDDNRDAVVNQRQGAHCKEPAPPY